MSTDDLLTCMNPFNLYELKEKIMLIDYSFFYMVGKSSLRLLGIRTWSYTYEINPLQYTFVMFPA